MSIKIILKGVKIMKLKLIKGLYKLHIIGLEKAMILSK
nr:MAG TPA: hypothetical protein [Caudoviricetes sp.]